MISLIVAMDMQFGIGRDNQLLCHLPNDLKYFKEMTRNNIVVMGRKTFESLPVKPLPMRANMVLTRNEEFYHDNVIKIDNPEYVINMHDTLMINGMEKDIFIIGGSEVYNEFIDYADRLYITRIQHTFEEVDTFFPSISFGDWIVTEVTKNYKDKNHKYDYDFVVMDRRDIEWD